MTVVLDTNVLVVAHEQLIEPACVEASLGALLEARSGAYVLDDDGEILGQYKANIAGARPHTPAFEFVIHVFQTQYDAHRCERVNLTPHNTRGYDQFPDDPMLADFDPSDRVFAAAARHRCEVVNATDSDWWNHRDALMSHGIQIRFLCPNRFIN